MEGGLVAGVRITVREWKGESLRLMPRHVSRRTAWVEKTVQLVPQLTVLYELETYVLVLVPLLGHRHTRMPASLHSRRCVV